MKIGVRAHDFGRMSEENLPPVVKKAGFDCVQLALTKAIQGIETLSQVTPSLLAQIRQSFAENNVEISVFGCYIEPALADREERLKQVDKFLLGLEQAKALGVTVVGTETTNFDPDSAQEFLREAAYQNLKDSILRMTEKAEKLDIQIAIEPVADHTLNSAILAKRLLNEVGSDKLKIILDPVNLILVDTVHQQEQIYKEFIEILGEKIVAVHIKDIVFEGSQKVWRNIGKGIVSYGYIFEWMCQNKPNIPILREHVRLDSFELDVDAMRQLAMPRIK